MTDGPSSPDIFADNSEPEQKLTDQWLQLNDEGKTAVIYLSMTSPLIGDNEKYLEAMGIKKEEVDHLIQVGLVESKTRSEIAQQFVQQHKSQVEAIRRRELERIRSVNGPRDTLSEDERKLLRMYDNEEGVVGHNSEEVRFILNDAMRNFVIKNFSDPE